jgi:hypothetical protein
METFLIELLPLPNRMVACRIVRSHVRPDLCSRGLLSGAAKLILWCVEGFSVVRRGCSVVR